MEGCPGVTLVLICWRLVLDECPVSFVMSCARPSHLVILLLRFVWIDNGVDAEPIVTLAMSC